MVLDLADPVTVSLVACAALRDAGQPHALYGGLLLASYGEARETRDADLAVLQCAPGPLLRALRAAGLMASVSMESMVFGGLVLSRVGLLGNADTVDVNSIDLVAPRSTRFGHAMLARSLATTLRGQAISAVSPEDFVLFKALSTRERDLDDAASVVLRMAGDLDTALLDEESRLLASELPDVDVIGRLRSIRERAAKGLPGL